MAKRTIKVRAVNPSFNPREIIGVRRTDEIAVVQACCSSCARGRRCESQCVANPETPRAERLARRLARGETR